MEDARPDQKSGNCSRRQALKAGALAGAGAALAWPASASAARHGAAPREHEAPAEETKNMHLSLAAYSMRDALESGEMDLFALIDWCAEMGLPGAELTSYFFEEDFDAAYLNRLQGHAFRRGVTVSGTAIRNDFCLPPGPERQEQIDHVRQWIDHAAEFYAPHVRIFAGSLPEGADRETGIARVAEGIEAVLPHAEERGVVLGLENHGTFTGDVDTHLAICDAIGEHPWFGINLDTGNYQSDAYESLARAAPRAVNVQVKALIRDGEGAEVPVDLERIRQILVDADYKGWVALEYEEENPRETIPEYAGKMKELFG